jgi:hypothetical protein
MLYSLGIFKSRNARVAVNRHYPRPLVTCVAISDLTTIGTISSLYTDCPTAFLTRPPFVLVLDMMPHSILPDLLQTIDHAVQIVPPVSFIQSFHPQTWENRALIAEDQGTVFQPFTILDTASDALNRFAAALVPAARASILHPEKAHTDHAIGATGCDVLRQEFHVY